MDAIPPDIAKKLLNRDFANLVKRVQAGGKISRTERAMLQSMAADAGGDGPTPASSHFRTTSALNHFLATADDARRQHVAEARHSRASRPFVSTVSMSCSRRLPTCRVCMS